MSPAPGTTLEMAPAAAAGGGPWTPASLPGIVAWWDSSDAATITASGSPLRVSQWNDKSGNARHLVQAGAAKPRTGTRTINGLNAVEFIASGVEMMTASGIAQNPTARHFIGVIAQDIDLGALHGGANPNTGAPECRMGDGFPCLLSTSVAHHHGTGLYKTGTMLYEVAVDTTAHTIKWYKDEAQFGITNTDVFTYTAASSGGQQIGSCDFAPAGWDGAIGEFIITNTIVTGADLTSLYNYLNAKWFSSLPGSVPGLVAWLDASDTATITQSGGLVSQWSDKSGNGHHFTQATSANQPTTGTRTMNGLNAVDFDGTSDIIGNTSMADAAAATIFLVVYHDAQVGQDAIWGNPGDAGGWVTLSTRQPQHGTGSGNVVFNELVPVGAPCLLTFGPKDSGPVSLWIDGTACTIASGTGGNYGGGGISLGGRYMGGPTDWPWDGLICELLVYQTTLPTVQRQAVEAYLRAKWGTP